MHRLLAWLRREDQPVFVLLPQPTTLSCSAAWQLPDAGRSAPMSATARVLSGLAAGARDRLVLAGLESGRWRCRWPTWRSRSASCG